MKQIFYSNGKLFLIGEYTVIDGSKAFALPTIYGQYLHIEEGTGKTLEWKSYDADKSLWLEALISFEAIINNIATGDKVTDTLIGILHTAHNMNPELLISSSGLKATTELTFPRNWGLGSSSTLINNIAQWFGIDAFELLNKSFGGSGYDIACAQHNTPIIYTIKDGIPVVEEIQFNPAFTDKLYFVYLNKKQNSRSAILDYRQKAKDLPHLISQVDAIIEEAYKTEDFEKFCELLDEHSSIMSKALQLETVKEELFPDFPGTVKSLGAWGGDFILAASESNPEAYFRDKGYSTVIPYNQMILQ